MCSSLCRWVLTAACVVFTLAGGAVLVLVQTQTPENPLQRCPQCTSFKTVLTVVASVVLLLGLVGLMAVYQRSQILAIFLKVGFFLLFVVAAAWCVLVILMRVGKLDIVWEKGWREAVDDGAQTVCEFEFMFACSGWDTMCPPNSSAVRDLPSGCPRCSPTMNITARETCASLIHRTFDSHYDAMFIGGVIAIGVIAALNFIAFCAKQSFKYVDEVEEDVVRRHVMNSRRSLASSNASDMRAPLNRPFIYEPV